MAEKNRVCGIVSRACGAGGHFANPDRGMMQKFVGPVALSVF
jgi:hypothetical protein